MQNTDSVKKDEEVYLTALLWAMERADRHFNWFIIFLFVAALIKALNLPLNDSWILPLKVPEKDTGLVVGMLGGVSLVHLFIAIVAARQAYVIRSTFGGRLADILIGPWRIAGVSVILAGLFLAVVIGLIAISLGAVLPDTISLFWRATTQLVGY